MTNEIDELKRCVDGWIKYFNQQLSILKNIQSKITESQDNIQHNYELIYEIKDDIEELKQEINALKLIQVIQLKEKVKS